MRKISGFLMIVWAIAGSLIAIVFYKVNANTRLHLMPAIIAEQSEKKENCSVKLTRLSGLNFTKPLMYVDRECEADKFQTLKANIFYYLNTLKSDDPLSSVSVYLFEFNQNNWMGINNDEYYNPASLLKVVTLITYLRIAEAAPQIMNQKINFAKNIKIKPPTQHFNSKTIQPGNTYSVKELLHYMIANSDNYATWLLNNYISTDYLLKTYTDFGFQKPNLLDRNYLITAKDFSHFMRAIYNAGYLTISSSEIAISMLNDCDFNEGIAKGIPNSVIIAHKFGESGNLKTHQLHESAIVFLENKPYLLTIMTKGKDIEKMPEVLSNISSMVYKYMSENSI